MECVFRPVLSAITAGTVAVSLGQFINRHKQEVDHTRFVLAPCFALLLFTVTALLRRRYSGAVKSERQEEDEENEDYYAQLVGSPDQMQRSFSALLAQRIPESVEMDTQREGSDTGVEMSTGSQDSDQDCHVMDPPEPPPPSLAARPAPSAGQACRVMVIDDDNINHMVIKRVLSKAGKFEIRKFLAADTALASLDALHSSSGYADFPHVILMDVNMPGISGIEAAQVIKKSYPGAVLPVIVITGHSSSHMRETALDAGCVDVVVKPIQASELVSKVMAAVETCIDTR